MNMIIDNCFSELRKKYAGVSGFRPIDFQFAEFIYSRGSESEALYQAALILSYVTGLQSSALDLKDIASKPIESIIESEDEPEKPSGIKLPEYDEWIEVLTNQNANLVGNPGERKPLILADDGLLYLYRYWAYEFNVCELITSRCRKKIASSLPPKEVLSTLFSESASTPDWQRVGTFAAYRNYFTIISGGPGTGKTTTVAKLLTLLVQGDPEGKLKIDMVAPTGKAADRLVKSIQNVKNTLIGAVPADVLARIPQKASTIHTYLKYLPATNAFRKNKDSRTDSGILIVDEASMVSLPMFFHLLQALPDECRVILLGDKDQLASVETGCVFGDLTSKEFLNNFNNEFIADYDAVCSDQLQSRSDSHSMLSGKVIKLEHSYRFDATSGIGYLSYLINEGEAAEAVSFLVNQTLTESAVQKIAGSGKPAPNTEGFTDISYEELPSRDELKHSLADSVSNKLSDFKARVSEWSKRTMTPEEADEAASAVLDSFDSFRVLCAVNRGSYGIENLNKISEDVLFGKKRGLFYSGRPVMILKNDHNQKLYNGDVGVILKRRGESPLVYFRGDNNKIRSLAPAFLPEHITAFAMTVHKSQGSEFNNVLMILPNNDSKILTREILYTGVTRAKKSVEVWADTGILEKAIERRLKRTSGLKAKLLDDKGECI